MPFDLPGPADDPDEPSHRRPADALRPADASPPLPDPAVLDEKRRANRALVDSIYAAVPDTTDPPDTAPEPGARPGADAWSDAVSRFEAEWLEHVARHPDQDRPIPQGHPDGSWSCGERRLSAEQNAEASKACADIHDEGTRVILPAMQRIEAADPNRHLAGLENMLKKEDRLKEKIADALRARPELTAAQALSIVPDPIRFTYIYRPGDYAEGVLADVERLKETGLEEVKLKNLWSDEQYKGINSQWCRRETGLRVEVQFHTLESLEAKELTHEAYERIRSPDTSPAERQELEAFQRRVNALLDTPPSTDEVKDFPESDNG